MSGLFGAVAPIMPSQLMNLHRHLLAGGIVFLLFVCSAAGQLAIARTPDGLALGWGCAA